MPGKGKNGKGGKGGNRNGKGNGKGKGRNGGKTRGYRGITQSVALSVNNAYGDTAKPQTVIKGLDAFDTSHVPLPRAVGDYTVIRTTEIFGSDTKFNLLGPIRNGPVSTGGPETWSNICALHSVGNPTYAINAAGGTGQIGRAHV